MSEDEKQAVRLPLADQKALVATELVASVNGILVAIDETMKILSASRESIEAAVMSLARSRERVRIKFALLQKTCPEVVAQWRGPIFEMPELDFVDQPVVEEK
jgi:hypothetical protein